MGHGRGKEPRAKGQGQKNGKPDAEERGYFQEIIEVSNENKAFIHPKTAFGTLIELVQE